MLTNQVYISTNSMNIDSYSVYIDPVSCCLLDIITFKVISHLYFV